MVSRAAITVQARRVRSTMPRPARPIDKTGAVGASGQIYARVCQHLAGKRGRRLVCPVWRRPRGKTSVIASAAEVEAAKPTPVPVGDRAGAETGLAHRASRNDPGGGWPVPTR
jgi:hypothetical protein